MAISADDVNRMRPPGDSGPAVGDGPVADDYAGQIGELILTIIRDASLSKKSKQAKVNQLLDLLDEAEPTFEHVTRAIREAREEITAKWSAERAKRGPTRTEDLLEQYVRCSGCFR